MKFNKWWSTFCLIARYNRYPKQMQPAVTLRVAGVRELIMRRLGLPRAAAADPDLRAALTCAAGGAKEGLLQRVNQRVKAPTDYIFLNVFNKIHFASKKTLLRNKTYSKTRKWMFCANGISKIIVHGSSKTVHAARANILRETIRYSEK